MSRKDKTINHGLGWTGLNRLLYPILMTSGGSGLYLMKLQMYIFEDMTIIFRHQMHYWTKKDNYSCRVKDVSGNINLNCILAN